MHILLRSSLFVAGSLLATINTATAATYSATSSNLLAIFNKAAAGDTINLSGSFGSTTLAGKSWSSPVTINATRATFTDSLSIKQVNGLSFVGGKFGSTTSGMRTGRAVGVFGGSNINFSNASFIGNSRGTVKGLTFTGTTNVNVSKSSFTGFKSGIGVNGVRDVLFADNTVTGSISDGFNIANSHFVTATGNRCSGTVPAAGAHPDCIQLWSIAGEPVQSDIKLIGNFATGMTQGFTSFDPERGGGLRITMSGNRVDTSFPQGIACYACVDSIITDNVLTTQAGARFQTIVRVIGGSNNIVANNSIGSFSKPLSKNRMAMLTGSESAASVDFGDDWGFQDLAAESEELRAELALFRSGITELESFVSNAAPDAAGAVPEPLIWAQLLAGFALIGAAMRRGRTLLPARAL